MPQAKIMLAPVAVMRDIYLGNKEALVRNHLAQYTICKAIETTKEGEDAAEEMFDLTNNPSRQLEREQKYGRGRSLSVGDMVDVDGVLYACMPFGWLTIA